MMKLAIFASHLKDMGLPDDQAFEFGAKQGIKAVEADTGEFADCPPAEYRRLLENAGMRMIAAHHICRLSAADDAAFSDAIDSCKRAAEDIVTSGGEYMMLVPSIVEDIKNADDKIRGRERIIEGMNKVIKYTDECGLKLSIENFSKVLYPFSTADELVDMAENVPGLYLTLDAGNIRCLGGNCIDLYDKIKSRMLFCHVKSWGIAAKEGLRAVDGKYLFGSLLGEGVVPVGELMFRLKNDGYNGWLVIEQEAGGEGPMSQKIEHAAAYLKRLM